ncbi:MAG: pilus assembly protein, partial [Mesorhizobium sp.]
LLLLSLGIVEFGRAFFVRNDLSYAADIAARKVLIGQIPATASESDASAALNSAVRGAFESGDPDLLQVSMKTETVDGVTFRVLSIRYPFTLLLPELSDSPIALGVSRRIPVG